MFSAYYIISNIFLHSIKIVSIIFVFNSLYMQELKKLFKCISLINIDTSCTENISPFLTTLANDTNCRVSSSCTDIQCCTDMTIVGKTLNYRISVDACALSLNVEIEKFKFELSLINFKFGVLQKFSIDQVFSIE